MKNFFNSNLFYGILSVFMAVFLMFFVASAENPLIERSYTNINVAVSGLPESYLLAQEPGPVEIRASGYRSAVNLSTARDVRAYVDLRDAVPGTAHYPVQYTLPAGLSPVFVRPEFIALTIDEITTKELPVVCHTVNAVRQGYGHGEPVFSPSVISVSGPRQLLEEIAEAAVSVDLNERTVDYDAYLSVLLFDHTHQEIRDSRISMSADAVSVHIGISENQSSKNVTVRTALSGNVGDRYTVAGIEVNPSSVKITGSYSAVSTIEYLMTETIDLSLLTETYRGYVGLVTPEGVSILDGDQVELTVRLERNLTQRAFVNIPIELRNPPAGDTYQAAPSTVNLVLSAFPDLFEAATVDGELLLDIAVYVDLEGRIADVQPYPVMIEVPDDFEVVTVSEEEVALFYVEVEY